MKAIFSRVIEAEDKATVLREAVANGDSPLRFEVETASLTAIPRSPFAYWVRDRIRGLFVHLPAIESQGREARVGDHPGDSFRYLRLKWEVPRDSSRLWQDYQKGGNYSPYYFDVVRHEAQ